MNGRHQSSTFCAPLTAASVVQTARVGNARISARSSAGRTQIPGCSRKHPLLRSLYLATGRLPAGNQPVARLYLSLPPRSGNQPPSSVCARPNAAPSATGREHLTRPSRGRLVLCPLAAQPPARARKAAFARAVCRRFRKAGFNRRGSLTPPARCACRAARHARAGRQRGARQSLRGGGGRDAPLAARARPSRARTRPSSGRVARADGRRRVRDGGVWCGLLAGHGGKKSKLPDADSLWRTRHAAAKRARGETIFGRAMGRARKRAKGGGVRFDAFGGCEAAIR